MSADDAQTILKDEQTCGLGELRISHPPGTFAITPASLIALQAIGRHCGLLSGTGIDWGSGTGCLALAAARLSAVDRVLGMEISAADVDAARTNARLNSVEDKVEFFRADSFAPFAQADREYVESFKGRIGFILANPPASEGDDGFGFRRLVLRQGREFLAEGGLVFLNISSQYGEQRIERLGDDAPGFAYGGVLASTGRVPFDLERADLLDCLELYAQEERRGGLEYAFVHPDGPEGESLDARSALAFFRRTGRSPLSRWQTHLFRYHG